MEDREMRKLSGTTLINLQENRDVKVRYINALNHAISKANVFNSANRSFKYINEIFTEKEQFYYDENCKFLYIPTFIEDNVIEVDQYSESFCQKILYTKDTDGTYKQSDDVVESDIDLVLRSLSPTAQFYKSLTMIIQSAGSKEDSITFHFTKEESGLNKWLSFWRCIIDMNRWC